MEHFLFLILLLFFLTLSESADVTGAWRISLFGDGVFFRPFGSFLVLQLNNFAIEASGAGSGSLKKAKLLKPEPEDQ